MEAVTRINITDKVTLKRVAVAQKRFEDTTATKTAERLINAKLDDMGIPLFEPEPIQTPPPETGGVTVQR